MEKSKNLFSQKILGIMIVALVLIGISTNATAVVVEQYGEKYDKEETYMKDPTLEAVPVEVEGETTVMVTDPFDGGYMQRYTYGGVTRLIPQYRFDDDYGLVPQYFGKAGTSHRYVTLPESRWSLDTKKWLATMEGRVAYCSNYHSGIKFSTYDTNTYYIPATGEFNLINSGKITMDKANRSLETQEQTVKNTLTNWFNRYRSANHLVRYVETGRSSGATTDSTATITVSYTGLDDVPKNSISYIIYDEEYKKILNDMSGTSISLDLNSLAKNAENDAQDIMEEIYNANSGPYDGYYYYDKTRGLSYSPAGEYNPDYTAEHGPARMVIETEERASNGYQLSRTSKFDNDPYAYIFSSSEDAYGKSNYAKKYTLNDIQCAYWVLLSDLENKGGKIDYDTITKDGSELAQTAKKYAEFLKKDYKSSINDSIAQVIVDRTKGQYIMGPYKLEYDDIDEINYVKALTIEAGDKELVYGEPHDGKSNSDFEIVFEHKGKKGSNGLTKKYPAANEYFFVILDADKIGLDTTEIELHAKFEHIKDTHASYEEYEAQLHSFRYNGHFLVEGEVCKECGETHTMKKGTMHVELTYETADAPVYHDDPIYGPYYSVPNDRNDPSKGTHRTRDEIGRDTYYTYDNTTHTVSFDFDIYVPYIKMGEHIWNKQEAQSLTVVGLSEESINVDATIEEKAKNNAYREYKLTDVTPKNKIDLSMQLGGFVWVDENGGKEDVADGIFNAATEEKVPNIIVRLYRQGGTFVAETKTDAKGEYRFTKLPAMYKYYVSFTYNGQYYEPTTYTSPYDNTNGWGKGNWEVNSNATDIRSERIAYNNKFATIGSANNNYGTNKRTYTKMELLGYTLNEKGEYVLTNTPTIDKFGNLINANSQMAEYAIDSRMTAYTKAADSSDYDYYPTPDIFVEDTKLNRTRTYSPLKKEIQNNLNILYPTAYYINLGLHPRQESDIALKKDVEKVVLEINNHTHEYTYDTLDAFKCNSCGYKGNNSELIYRRDADFRWKLHCPKCDSTNFEANWDISVRLSDGYYNKSYSRELYKADYAYKVSAYGDYEKYGKSKTDELDIYVTYKVRVKNESLSIKMRVDELVDYYDSTYEVVPERSYIEIESGENLGKYSIVLSDSSTYGLDKKINGCKTVYARGIGKDNNSIYLSGGQSACFYITFKVQKESRDGEDWVILGEKGNLAEINGYSTMYEKGTIVPNVGDVGGMPAGLVDVNSTPGNQTSKEDIRENDTDKAPKINIRLNEDDDANRVISGTVWEDERTKEVQAANIADGIKQDNEELINGVTVQLVEIIDNPIDEAHSEFVWREYGSSITGEGTVGTGTGSGTKTSETPVINAKINGKWIVEDYNFGEANIDGTYAFKSFMPGNYVVRFIYGDKEATILPSTLGGLNEKSYNGQDYKSTTYQNGIDQNKVYEWRDLHSYADGKEILGNLLTTVSTFKADASNNETVKLPNRRVPGWTAIPVEEQKGYLYDITASDKSDKVSDAKDIESRRNAVIDYSDNDVTNTIAEILASHKDNYKYSDIERKALLEQLKTNTKMTAETGLMVIEFEYDRTQTDGEKKDNKYKIQNVNFGLEERPETKLTLEKRVSNIKVTLADGSILFDTKGKTNNVLWTKKLIQLTMDEEIMHGATIKIDYEIKVTNEGEVDYKDNLFYYTGKLSNNAEVVTTRADNVLDYVANNLQFFASENKDWKLISNKDIAAKDLVNKKLIDAGALEKYNSIIITDSLNKDLVPTTYTDKVDGNAQSDISVPLTLSQLITGENETDDLTYRNIAEIVKISNTVGRRNEEAVVGNQDAENAPTEVDTFEAEIVKILPPFGSNGEIYIIISAVALAISAITIITIIFIKRKH